jgi:hypothetical protein
MEQGDRQRSISTGTIDHYCDSSFFKRGPGLIYELKMEAFEAVRATAQSPDGGDDGDAIARASDSHVTPAHYVQLRHDAHPAATDVLRPCKLALAHIPFRVVEFYDDIHDHRAARLSASLACARRVKVGPLAHVP